MMKLGPMPEEAANLAELDRFIVDRMMQTISESPSLRWKIVQRGFWGHGATTMREYLHSVEQFTMDGRAEAISCPTLLTVAENDPWQVAAKPSSISFVARRLSSTSVPLKGPAITARWATDRP
jgi:hypothetical protein